MALQVNDWIWLRLSNRYGVTSAEAQLGDVFKRWLDERGSTYGFALVDFYASKNVAGATFGDGQYNYWSGGALQDATFWIDAFSGAGTSVANLGSGGSALNARYGSTTGVDISDPVLLPHTGTNYLYLPSVLGNDTTTPSAAPLNINGNIECVIRVALDDWTPTAAHTLVSKYNGTAATGGYEFQINPTGEMRSVWDNGVAVVGALSNAIPSFVDGTAYWLKYTIQPDNGAGGANCDFYWAADQSAEPSTWTRLGTQVVTTTTVNSIATSTSGLRIGSRNATSNQCQGKFYRAIVRNGIGGTTVFDANFTTGITSGSQTTFTESSVNAATVTINRSSSGRKSVAVVRPVWLFGTDDFMEVAADPYGAYVRTADAANANVSSAYTAYDTGTATAGASTTLDDTVKAWTVNAYTNRAVRITGGTGVGQVRVIASNTATQLTVTAAWVTIPDATSTYVVESLGNVNGDIEIVARCALDNWITGGNQPIVLKIATGGQNSYRLLVGSSGLITFAFTLDGSTSQGNSSAVVPPFTNGVPYWIRFRRTASTGAWTIDYAADQATEPSTWTSLSSGTGVAGNIWKGTAPLGVGGLNSIQGSAGKVYRAIVRDGIAGTTIVDWAAYGHAASGGSYVDARNTVWVAGSLTSVVNANPLNFGSTDSFTVVAIVRQWATPTSFGRYVDKKLSGAAFSGWTLSSVGTTQAGGIYIGDGTTGLSAATSTPTAGSLTCFTSVVDRTAQTATSFVNNTAGTPTSITTVGSLGSATTVRIGAAATPSGASSYQDFELLAVAVVPKALTAAEIARIVAAYQ